MPNTPCASQNDSSMLMYFQIGANCKINYTFFRYKTVYIKSVPLSGVIYDPKDFIWTNMNHHIPRMLCAKYQWILVSGLVEDNLNLLSHLGCGFVTPGTSFEHTRISLS